MRIVQLLSTHKVIAIVMAISLTRTVACHSDKKEDVNDSGEITMQKDTEIKRGSPEEALHKGKEFAPCFPEFLGVYEMAFTEKKMGVAEAILTKDSVEMAKFMVLDIANDPDMIADFQHAKKTINECPVLDTDDERTVMLVGNRFMIEVQSLNKEFDLNHRNEWLRRFKSNRLAKLNY
ncbi:hypothetical protein V6R21_14305 [Limibacter armeniacum]|uniref:hypothetical protein n=1 Tax=Limibacter armeniacum TaxID=466084 RepID=UPI002FE595FF